MPKYSSRVSREEWRRTLSVRITGKVVQSRPPRWKPRHNPKSSALRPATHSSCGSTKSNVDFERFGMKTDDADLVATTVLSQLEGALLLARTYRSLEPMHRAERAVKLLARVRQSE